MAWEGPMFTFEGLSLGDLARLCARITEATRDATTMEEAAAELTGFFRTPSSTRRPASRRSFWSR